LAAISWTLTVILSVNSVAPTIVSSSALAAGVLSNPSSFRSARRKSIFNPVSFCPRSS